jgi:hypothetical protein
MKTTSANVVPAFAGFAAMIPSIGTIARFTKNATTGKDGVEVKINPVELPWDNAFFVRGLIDLGISRLVLSGVHTQERFVEAAIKAGTPDPGVVKEAQDWLDAVNDPEDAVTWESIDSTIFKKYGRRLISHDMAGLMDHFAKKAKPSREDRL